MNINIQAVFVVCILMALFFLLGMKKTICKDRLSVGNTLIYGFVIYFMLFEIVALPFKLMLKPLSILSYVWLIVLILFCVFGGKKKKQRIHLKSYLEGKSLFYILVIVIIVIQITLVINNIHDGSPVDSAYYVGTTGSSVMTNTIEVYDPYTGMKREILDSQYLLMTYSIHNAVISKLTGIHPLIVYHQIMSPIVLIMNNVIFYKLAEEFFSSKEKECFIAWFIMLLVQYYSYSMYTTSGFLYYRAFEGKTIIGNVIIPITILFLIRTWKDGSVDVNGVKKVIAVSVCSITFSMSGVILMPVLLSMYYVPAIIIKRSKILMKQYVICMVVSFFTLILYLIVAKEVIVIPIR